MPMNPTLLESEIKSAIDAEHISIFPEAHPDQTANAERLAELIAKIAQPIILHIISNALVTVSTTVTVLPHPPGGAAVGSGTGTGTIS